jgi:hypothetical protein
LVCRERGEGRRKEGKIFWDVNTTHRPSFLSIIAALGGILVVDVGIEDPFERGGRRARGERGRGNLLVRRRRDKGEN